MAKKPNPFGAVMGLTGKPAATPETLPSQAEPTVGDDTPIVSPPAPAPAVASGLQKLPAAFRRGAVAGLHTSLQSTIQNSIRDIDVSLIDPSPFADRLDISDADVRDLAESISKNGQRVPILVRPNPEATGRFIIVYGRRRLAALKLIEQPAKAMVRDMTDEDAVLAQGQENNARQDPSFIEKALFLKALEEAGMPSEVQQDALCVNRSYLSHMRKVTNAIPEEIIRMVGPAHGVGWQRWHEAVELFRTEGITPSPAPEVLDSAESSADRFAAWVKFLVSQNASLRQAGASDSQPTDMVREKQKTPVFAAVGGAKIGEVRVAISGRVQILPNPEQVEFSHWLSVNGGDVLAQIYATWAKTEGR